MSKRTQAAVSELQGQLQLEEGRGGWRELPGHPGAASACACDDELQFMAVQCVQEKSTSRLRTQLEKKTQHCSPVLCVLTLRQVKILQTDSGSAQASTSSSKLQHAVAQR